MVEERVRVRVSAIFRREVKETVRELQEKLDSLVEENEMLRDAFAEANLRSKTMFWALYPPLWQTTMASTSGSGRSRQLLSVRFRMEAAKALWLCRR